MMASIIGVSSTDPFQASPLRERSASAESAVVPVAPSKGSEESLVSLASVQAEDLRSFLDARGMEIGFVLDRQSGVSRMVIFDPLSGRTLLEVPSRSPLESVAREVYASRS
jgi:hypothetical protein